jgi:hypothetical protein
MIVSRAIKTRAAPAAPATRARGEPLELAASPPVAAESTVGVSLGIMDARIALGVAVGLPVDGAYVKLTTVGLLVVGIAEDGVLAGK